jgi:hypothetical protein
MSRIAFARRASVGAIAASLLGLPGCGVLIGIEDIEVTPGAGGAGGDDATHGPASSSTGTGEAHAGSCGDPIPLAFNGWGTVEIDGETKGASALKSGNATGCDDSLGPEDVYLFESTMGGVLTARLSSSPETTFNSVLYARASPCGNGDGNTLCHNQVGAGNGGELISLPVMAGQKYFLVVDGHTQNDFGPYHLTVNFVSGSSCDSPVPIMISGPAGSTANLVGQNAGGSAASTACGDCPGNPCEGWGTETVYLLETPSGKGVEAKIAAGFDSLLYARSVCKDMSTQPKNACVNNKDKGDEVLSVSSGPSPVFLFVDTNITSSGGLYFLQLTVK